MSKNEKRVRRKSRKLSEAEIDVTEEPPKKRSRAQSSAQASPTDIKKKPQKLMVSFDINNLGSRVSSQLKRSKTSVNSPSSTEDRGSTCSFEQQSPAPSPIPSKKNIKTKFKSSKFCFTYLDSNKKRTWKGLKQIIQADKNAQWNPNAPTYSAIEAPPPLKPIKKYSDVSGLTAKYTDPLTGLYYASSEEFETIRSLSTSSIQSYLALRGKATIT